jgi:hypothetical protein
VRGGGGGEDSGTGFVFVDAAPSEILGGTVPGGTCTVLENTVSVRTVLRLDGKPSGEAVTVRGSTDNLRGLAGWIVKALAAAW